MKEGKVNMTECEFAPSCGAKEVHLVLVPDCTSLTFDGQCDALFESFRRKLDLMPGLVPVFERFFISDAFSQQNKLEERLRNCNCAVSIIQQPPLGGAKIAMLAVLIQDAYVTVRENGLVVFSHGSCKHILDCSRRIPTGTSTRQQTRELFLSYCERTDELGCTLADNCVRTWLFVNDIDNEYAGAVTARNEVFNSQGLTNETHFIASTGIGGRSADSRETVMMDAYAVAGLAPGQQHYLYAPTHMNRTSEYGVSFERGTVVDYGDRRHVLISGTASIDNKGRILYPGDVLGQTGRMLENVGQLLSEADCTFDDVMHMIVYLRDISDYRTVADVFSARFAGKPYILVYAPVCRPGWLVEMECVAARRCDNVLYDKF